MNPINGGFIKNYYYIDNNRSYSVEKITRKRNNDKLESLIEKEIPFYIKSFGDEIGKTLSEINNIKTKDYFYCLETNYEQLILPDYNNKCLNLRNSININFKKNKLHNYDDIIVHKQITYDDQKEIKIKNTAYENNYNKMLIDNNLKNHNECIESLIINNEKTLDGNYDNLNNKTTNSLINVKNRNNKYEYLNNSIYQSKSKIHKNFEFDIHIKDADDSAFEKLIID